MFLLHYATDFCGYSINWYQFISKFIIQNSQLTAHSQMGSGVESIGPQGHNPRSDIDSQNQKQNRKMNLYANKP